MAVQLITKAAYARHRGCDEKAVRKAITEGRISAIGGKIDPAVADIQWERNTRARVKTTQLGQGDLVVSADVGTTNSAAAAGPAGDVPERPAADPGYMEFRTRREKADALAAEANTAKLLGTMVLREDVDRGTFDVLREARDRLTAAGRRVASEVAALSTAEACEAVIDREHRIVLELLVTGFHEKLGSAPRASE